MNKKIISVAVFVGLFALVNFAFAQVQIPNPLGSTDSFTKLLLNIISGVGMVIASLGTIMIVVAGILYLSSAGSPERMTTAKKALFYAIIGIALGITAKTIADIIVDILKTGAG